MIDGAHIAAAGQQWRRCFIGVSTSLARCAPAERTTCRCADAGGVGFVQSLLLGFWDCVLSCPADVHGIENCLKESVDVAKLLGRCCWVGDTVAQPLCAFGAEAAAAGAHGVWTGRRGEGRRAQRLQGHSIRGFDRRRWALAAARAAAAMDGSLEGRPFRTRLHADLLSEHPSPAAAALSAQLKIACS